MTTHFEDVFDYYQAAVYQRELLAESIGRLILAARSERILDCACGTGLPALDLRQRGFSVDCSDADPRMLEQFRRNALERRVVDTAWQLRWDALHALSDRYDLVMCRGNSLVYAESWEREDHQAAALSAIERHLTDIARAVAPGGYLMVDAPRTNRLGSIAYPEVTFRDKRVQVEERVTLEGGQRRWDISLRVGHDDLTFVRYSSPLVGADLTHLLHSAGFIDLRSLHLDGERPSYEVLLARKPRTNDV